MTTLFGDLDHVVVGPTCVFVLDSKNWRGVVSSDGNGELFFNDEPTDKQYIRQFVGRMLGNRAFVTGSASLPEFDVSDPDNPQYLGYAVSGMIPSAITIANNQVYAVGTAGSFGLYIYNINNIVDGNLQLVGSSTGGQHDNGDHMAVSGGYVFCSGGQYGFHVYNANNPSSPAWANSQGGSGSVTGTTNWSVTNIMLLPGTNVLTVTAFDEAGNTSNAMLTVIYQTTNQNQTITFPAIADHTFGDPPIPLVAAASSGLPVTFSVVSGPATLSTSNVLTLTGAGAVTVEADQSGNSGFNPAPPVDISFNVAMADQSIAFAPVPNHSASDPPFALTATTSSGLPVHFDILSGPAVLDTNDVVTLLGAGTVTVIAWQPGNSNYNEAASVQQSFNVSQIPQTITFGTLSQQKQDDAPFPLNATASSGLPVSFSVSGPAILSGNILTLTDWGTVTVTASQSGNNTYAAASDVTQSLVVTPPNNTLVSLGFQTNDGFQMAFYGMVESNYTLQASADLANWTSILNFTCTNSPTVVVDPGAMYLGWRFYRVAQGTLPILMQLNLNADPFSKTNGFGLNLQAPLGFNYTIQVSTDLLNWQSLTNFVSTNSLLYFSDPAATNYNRRFYRAVMP